MPSPEYDDIRNIKDFKSLIKYLRKDLNWPVDEEQVDDLSFEYKAAELGIDDTKAVKIKEIKQLRPLTGNQPWGVFWIQFEQKQLPVVVMRRILSALVKKQRGRRGSQKTWDLPDLMFISAQGEPERIVHVMIYAGAGRVVEASGKADGVRTISLSERFGLPFNKLETGIEIDGKSLYFGTLL